MSNGVLTGAARAFASEFGASRETAARLQHHLELLAKWNPAINLVAPSTVAHAWRRHFADSAQLWSLAPPGAASWLDLGAGAGFPGLVIAAIAAERAPDLRVALVESDHRKAAFLDTVARETGLAVAIHTVRVDTLDLPPADVVSARALAPLHILIEYTAKLRRPDGSGLFPKGRAVHKEIADAERRRAFQHRLHASCTDPAARVVEIGAINGRGPNQS